MAVLAAFALVQTASLAVFSRAGVPGSVPAHLSPQLGGALYARIVRAAPAPYALDMLARSEFDRHDYGAANASASRLPPGAQRSEWLGKLADARGERQAALAYYLSAGDASEVQARIDELAQRDPRAAEAMEERLIARMARDGDHPDAVADATWALGVLIERGGDRPRALQLYRRASQIAPINAKYLLSLAGLERRMGLAQAAREDMARARDVDPRLTP